MESDRSAHHHFHHFHTLPPDVSVSATNTSLDFSLRYRGIPRGAIPALSFTGPLNLCEDCISQIRPNSQVPTPPSTPPTYTPRAEPKTDTPLAENPMEPSGATGQQQQAQGSQKDPAKGEDVLPPTHDPISLQRHNMQLRSS